MKHVLKCWPAAYDATEAGTKLFEYRFDDRDYEMGDQLALLRWDPHLQLYTGRGTVMDVTYILRGRHGVPDGYCVMGLKFTGVSTDPESCGVNRREIKK